MGPLPELPSRRGEDFSQELARKGWYHSFELPDGTRIDGYCTIPVLRERYARLPIPENLSGKRVLDLGAWDGWFSFEAERHGAEVTAIDCVEMPHFVEIRDRLGSGVDYRVLDFYEIPDARLGVFDYVFCLGILYHLKHPLLALEIVCALATDTAIVEGFVTDAETWREHQNDVPTMEFYETDELANQLDNWVGPTVGCLMAMCRAAGFARVELLHSKGQHASVACFRKWEAPAEWKQDPPEVLGVVNTRSFGINFSTRKEEYISCRFRTAREDLRRDQLRFEVDGFGVPALKMASVASGVWQAAFRLPPGLTPGWKSTRLRLEDSGFSREFRIAVDMPLHVEELAIRGVRDAATWSEAVQAGPQAHAAAWVAGLPENCDRVNVHALLDDVRLELESIGAEEGGCRQVNCALPADVEKREHSLRISCGGVTSAAWPLKIQ